MASSASVSASGNQEIDGLISGVKWDTDALTFSFPDSGSYYGSVYAFLSNEPSSLQAFNLAQQTAVRETLAQYEAVSGLSFSEITETASTHAVLRYAESSAPSTAWAYYPSSGEWGGDSWFGTFYYNSPTKGNYAYHTILHETGHALGLKHGHETDGNGALPTAHDSMEYSVMTYRAYVGSDLNGYANEAFGFAQTLMMNDVAAMQYMHGANYSHNSGDTTYAWNPNTGELSVDGVGQGAAGANRVFMNIWDGGGEDTYDFSAYTTAVNVNLAPGEWTVTASDQLANLGSGNYARGNVSNSLLYNDNESSLIENAIGTAQNDTLTGNQGVNTLQGGLGSDTLTGLAGNDRLDAGSVDLSSYQASVYRLYGATLDRAPDVDGLNAWSNAYEGGTLLESIASGFLGSTEFQNIYGTLNNTQFVTTLYNNVLDRAPDSGGLATWVGQLDAGSSRESVVLGFSESAEYIRNTDFAAGAFSSDNLYSPHLGEVFRTYHTTLGRTPDASGFENWVYALDSGTALSSVVDGFVESAEFQAAYGALNNEQFVTLLYNNALSRAPDAGGLATWTGILDAGEGRENVVLGFSESDELKITTAEALQTHMQGTMIAWRDTLDGGLHDDDLLGGRGGDVFVFDANEDGSDTIYGLDNWDVLNFQNFSYGAHSEVLANMSESSGDVVFTDQGVTVTLLDTTLSSLDDADLFSFA